VIAVTDVTTVVVTSTITGLAADSVLGTRKRNHGSGRCALGVLLIVLGAVAGAALLRWHAGAGLLLAAAIVICCTLHGREQPRAKPDLPTTPTPRSAPLQS
jgi:uncharacterized membrane protein YoaK (UPF0700 family)